MTNPFSTVDSASDVKKFFTWQGQRYSKFDAWGRYNIPDPETGKVIPRIRATTYAKTLSDTFALSQWSQRMVAFGLSRRPDLRSLAAATSLDDKDTLNRIAEDAKAAAGSKQSANLGSAMHGFTELLDRGEDLPSLSPEEEADVMAYKNKMREAGITVEPGRIEQTVVWPEHDVSGTFDRLVRMSNGDLVVGDLKTGKDLTHSFTEIVIQLGIYASASHIWHWESAELEAMPEVSKEYAIVMHLPVGKAECTLYQINIAAGIEAAELCRMVRGWRKRKDLAVPLSFASVREVAPLNKDLARIEAATNKAALAKLWSELQPFGKWTTEIDLAAKRKAESFT